MQELVAVVSLKTVARNFDRLARAAGCPLYAVVKDDAYGHGAERIALALEKKAGALAVALVEEGVALRVAGVTKDILVLTPPLDGEDAARIAGYNLTASIPSLSALNLLKNATWGGKIRAHIAVNTGMNRYGVRPERAGYAAREAKRAGIEVTGVYSHFYLPQDGASRIRQEQLFLRAAGDVREIFPQAVRHIAATGGVLSGGFAGNYDAARAGIGLYGYLPAGFESAVGVQPAMKIYARVGQAFTFTEGGIGYAKSAKRYQKLHTLRLGYGDGFLREGAPFSIGKLCMDACICEGKARFGAWKCVMENASAYAAEHGTTEYEVLVNIARRAAKVYV